MSMKISLRVVLLLAVLVLPALALAQGPGFVPLTDIQAIKYVGNEGNSLPAFLNSIYKVCIGLAAVIGVLQLMRAGLTWMTAGGSHEKIGQARNLIRDTLLGLLLVLAPTIVFSIINPSILNLEIGGLSELKLPGSDSATNGDNTCDLDCQEGFSCKAGKCEVATTLTDEEASSCTQKGGKRVSVCYIPSTKTYEPLLADGRCMGGREKVERCSMPLGYEPLNKSSCFAYAQTEIRSIPKDQQCSVALGPDWESASGSCCIAIDSDQQCCGRRPQTAAPPTYGSGSFNFKIAVRSSDFTKPGSPSCVRYETGSNADSGKCSAAAVDAETMLKLNNEEYVVVKTCANVQEKSLQGTALYQLPTCSL